MSEDTEAPMSAVDELAELQAREAEEARLCSRVKAEADAKKELESRKTFRALKEKYGPDLKRIDTEAGMVVIKRVGSDTYRQFEALVLNEDQRGRANDFITSAAVVHPAPDTWDQWTQKYGVLSAAVSKHVVDFAGGVAKEKKA
jgi:hypothetical protein